MKTVSILQYDAEDHQFYPSFVIHNDLADADNECAFDEVILQPSEQWMNDYLQWNRFGRLPDDPAEDLSEEDDPSSLIPTFDSTSELQLFNAQGHDLTQRLLAELEHSTAKCGPIRVAEFKPVYSNMVVGPISAWWHVKDCNYGFVVPVQYLPVSDSLKSRLQAFRCHKGMEFWKLNDLDTMQKLQQEGRDLQNDLLRELQGSKETKKSARSPERAESCASIGAMLEQSCSLVAAGPAAAARLPLVQSRAQ